MRECVVRFEARDDELSQHQGRREDPEINGTRRQEMEKSEIMYQRIDRYNQWAAGKREAQSPQSIFVKDNRTTSAQ